MTYLYYALLVGLLGYLIWRRYRSHIDAWLLKLPMPQHRLRVERNISIPMRDGIRLACDIFRPKEPGRYPCLIARTPYSKTGNEHNYQTFARLYATQGYVVIVQDVRGKHMSEGVFDPYINEGSDGHDTIEWAGTQPWCTGKVGMVGFSYLGSCAWLAAPHRSRYLKTIVPVFTCLNTYAAWMADAVPFVKDMFYWIYKHRRQGDTELSHTVLDPALRTLPVNEIDEALGEKVPLFRTFLSERLPSPFWSARSSNHLIHKIDVPALIYGGWYDPFTECAINEFLDLRNSEPPSKSCLSRFIIGPYAHNPRQRFKEIKFARSARFRYQFREILDWLDGWLKEGGGPPHAGPAIRYYVMGKDEWRETESWPPKEVVEESFFLTSQGHANSDKGDGRLLNQPPHQEGYDSYVYDPEDPVPSIGNRLLYGNGLEGPKDQRVLTHRNDILVYNSEVLAQDFEITGFIRCILFVATSAVDTDFSVKIADVQPDGKALFLHSGFLRMRYRNGPLDEKLVEPGKVYQVQVELGSFAHLLKAGHRIQLLITSSDFPARSRNLNTGADNEFTSPFMTAQQSLYHGPRYPSRLILPRFNLSEPASPPPVESI